MPPTTQGGQLPSRPTPGRIPAVNASRRPQANPPAPSLALAPLCRRSWRAQGRQAGGSMSPPCTNHEPPNPTSSGWLPASLASPFLHHLSMRCCALAPRDAPLPDPGCGAPTSTLPLPASRCCQSSHQCRPAPPPPPLIPSLVGGQGNKRQDERVLPPPRGATMAREHHGSHRSTHMDDCHGRGSLMGEMTFSSSAPRGNSVHQALLQFAASGCAIGYRDDACLVEMELDSVVVLRFFTCFCSLVI